MTTGNVRSTEPELFRKAIELCGHTGLKASLLTFINRKGRVGKKDRNLFMLFFSYKLHNIFTKNNL